MERSALPRRALAHLLPHHISVLDAHFETAGLVPMVRMSLEADEYSNMDDAEYESWALLEPVDV